MRPIWAIVPKVGQSARELGKKYSIINISKTSLAANSYPPNSLLATAAISQGLIPSPALTHLLPQTAAAVILGFSNGYPNLSRIFGLGCKANHSCLEDEGWKILRVGHCIFSHPEYFWQFKENNAQAFWGTIAPRLDDSYNHCPYDTVWAQLDVQNRGSWMFMLRVKSLSALDSKWGNSRRRKM